METIPLSKRKGKMLSEILDSRIIKGSLTTSIMGCNVHYFPSIDSTMNEALKLALGDAPEGTLVIADEQTSGRGRFCREWISPPNSNLYLSLILHPSRENASKLAVMSSLALAHAIRITSRNNLSVSIKWPNDVQVGARKIGGILIEGALNDGNTHRGFSIIGIGVNVNIDPNQHSAIKDVATSMKQESGKLVSRLKLLTNLMVCMEELYNRLNRGESLIDEWKTLLNTIGQRVRLKWKDQVLDGVAYDVDQDGSLILLNDRGALQAFPAGEVTLQA